MDWKDIGEEVAKLGLPILGAALPLPGGAAIGAALAASIGAPSSQPVDVLATLKQAVGALDSAKQFEIENHTTLVKIQVDAETRRLELEAQDRDSARRNNSSHEQLWVIAWLVLITFAIGMFAVLYGCYALLTGGITIRDVAVVAAVSGLVGSIVGYLAANAQTVINFLYGGSLGSRNSAGALADATRNAVQTLGGNKGAASGGQ